MRGVQNNLPVQLTSFVGRRAQCAAVAGLVGENRLVTLTGAGGCGKTRIAIRVAGDLAEGFPGGVCWVDLARLSDGELLVNAVASALELKEAPGQSLIDTLKSNLHDRPLLLVLDNCEHVVAACAQLIYELLVACPALTVLATSREPIGVEGEVVWRVPSLELPAEDPTGAIAELSQSEAVRLFIERALRVDQAFRLTGENALAVAEICRRLDGMPLAIELAAARIRMMSPGQVVAGLTDSFRLLTGSTRTTLARHQTLRASIDWSYGLLSDEERVVFRRLAVFAGGFGLDAVEAVCSERVDGPALLDIVGRLIDRSLVQTSSETTDVRYRMHEAMRQYADERLSESGEEEAVRRSHLVHFISVAERGAPEMEGGGLLDWLPRFDAEHDNFRTALDWSARAGATHETLRLAAALWIFWQVRGHLTEGRRRLEVALEATETDLPLRVEALVGAGQIMTFYGDFQATKEFATSALEVARKLGDKRLEGRALDTLAYGLAFLDPPTAPAVFLEAASLSRNAGDDLYLADALNGIGIARYFAGDYAGARAALEDGVERARKVGQANILTIGLGVLGYTLGLQGRLAKAQTCFRESLPLARRLQDRVWTAQALYGMGFVAALGGDYDRAEAHLEESVETGRDVSPMILSFALLTRGLTRYMRGDLEGSGESLEEALSLSGEMGPPWLRAWSLALLGNAARIRGDLELARSRVDEALAAARSGGAVIEAAIDAAAKLASDSGDLERAESLHHQALSAARKAESVLHIPAQLEALAGLAALAESFAEAARLFGAAEAGRDAYGLARYAVDAPGYEADVERVRSALSAAEFDEAWKQGRSMSLEEAVAYASRGRGERKRPSSGWASLTPTEIEVVRHVAAGLTNPQIAERLFVSRSTVKQHLGHIFTKLGVSARAELASEAARRGF
ncbi:MAG: tetratricopeptide repeat protein [Actinomycetota bacterium]